MTELAICVLLIDDDSIVLSNLKVLLEKDPRIVVVATAGDAYSALEAVQHHRVDVVLCDIVMPNGDGLVFLQKLRALGQDLPVVMMTNAVGKENLAASLRLGASGYVTKDSKPVVYREAVHQAVNRSLTVSPSAVDLLRKVVVEPQLQQLSALQSQMSELETDVLRLVCQGMSNSEIANELHYSVATVKKTLASLFAMFEVQSRAALAFQAATIGFS